VLRPASLAAMRLFLALYPPVASAHALRSALDGLALPPHRTTALDQLHLTVLFLGDVAARELPALQESVERAAAAVEPFELAPERLAALPEQGLPRLIAAVTDAPRPLLELRRRLVARLAANKVKSSEFLPHFTLCRFGAPVKFELPSSALRCAPFRVDALSLQDSVLRQDGAEHRQLARFVLGSS